MKTTIKILLLFASVFLISACSREESGDSCGKITIENYTTEPTTIYVLFNKRNNVNSTRIEIGPTGFNQGTGRVITTSDNTVYFENLNPSTTYDLYFTGICSDSNESVVTKLSSITTDQGQCTGVASATFSQSTGTSVTLSLSYNSSSPSYYEVEYGPVGFTLGSGTRVNTSTQFISNNITLSGFQSNTTYDFYVRAVCSSAAPTDTSNFIKYTYTTVSSCPAPINLNSYITSGTCSTGATRMFTWNSSINAQNYTICVVRAGDQPSDTSNAFTTSTTSKSLSNVTCSFIGFYVRANCSATESSSWSGPYYF